MTIVGTAYVRLQVLSDKLGSDIEKSVSKSLKDAGLDDIGKKAGQQVSDGVNQGIKNGSKDLDTTVAKTGENIGKTLSTKTETEVNRGWHRLEEIADNAGRRIGQRMGTSTSKETDQKVMLGMTNMFKKLSKFKVPSLGSPIVSAIALAGPSVLATIGALGTAMATELVTAIQAIGPGIAGAAGLAGAAFMSLGISAGLVMVGFKSLGEEAKPLQDNLKKLKDEFGKPIGRGMLTGFQDLVQDLRDSVPQLTELLKDTGKAAGDAARSWGKTVTSGENMSRIKDILSTNVKFMGNFAHGVEGLTTSFLILGRAMKPFVDYIGDSVAYFGDWAASSLALAESNGQLAAWMDKMLQKAKQLGGTLTDFAKGFAGIFRANAPFAQKMRDHMEGIARNFHAWVDSDVGQAKLTKFFEKAHELGSKVLEIFGKIFKAAGNAFTNMDTGNLMGMLDTLENRVLPAIATMFSQIRQGFGAHLPAIIDNIAGALERVAASGNLEKIAGFMGTILEKATGLLNTDVGGAIFSTVGPLLLLAGPLTALVGPLTSVIGAIGGIGISGTFVTAAAGIGAVAGAFYLMWDNSDKLQQSVKDLWEQLSPKFVAIWDEIWPKVENLKDKIIALASALGDRLAPALDGAVGPLQSVVDILGGAVNFVVDWIGDVIDVFTAIFQGDTEKLRLAIGKMFSDIGKFLWTIVKGLWNIFWTLIVQNIMNLASWLWDIVKKKFIEIWDSVFKWFEDVRTGIGKWFTDTWNTMFKGFEDWRLGIGKWFTDTWNDIFKHLEDWRLGIGGFFSGLWDTISGPVIAIFNGLKKVIGFVLAVIWGVVATFGKIFYNILVVPVIAAFQILWGVIQWVKDFISTAWDWITEKVYQAGQLIYEYVIAPFQRFWEWISGTAWPAITGVVSGIWDWITGFVYGAGQLIYEYVVAPFQRFWEWISGTAFPAVMGAVSGLWDWITGFVYGAGQLIFEYVIAPFQRFWDWISGTAFPAVMGAISGLWDGITQKVYEGGQLIFEYAIAPLQRFWDWISGTLWPGITGTISGIWDGITGKIYDGGQLIYEYAIAPLQRFWDWISGTLWPGITGTISDIWNAISGVIKGGINLIIRGINWFIEKINGISIHTPDVPGTDWGGFDWNGMGLPLIPELAIGGVIKPRIDGGGTLAMIAEAGRPERVEPLDATGLSKRDHAIIAKLAGGGQQGGDTYIELKIGEQALSDIVAAKIRSANNALGQVLLNGRRVTV